MENMLKENAVPTYVKPYKEMMIDSDQLEVPRNTYQRRQEPDQITKIDAALKLGSSAIAYGM